MRQLTCLLVFVSTIQTYAYPSKIPIQSFTTPADLEQGINAVLNFTVSRLNSQTQNPFLLSYSNKALRTATGDSWGVMQTVCSELEEGFMLMLVGNTQRHHQAYTSVANSLEIPMINWDLSPNSLPGNPQNNFELSLKPPNAELLADLIVLKKWDYFVYMHDTENTEQAAQNIQLIYTNLQKITNKTIKSEIVKLPPDIKEFGDFLMDFNIKRVTNNDKTRVIVDMANAYRQQQILQAIRSAQFNQLNYHYVMANFDFLPYDVEMFKNGHINITGFQILARESIEYDHLKRFIHQMNFEQQLDDTQHEDADLQARLAFAHDAVLVAKTALEGTLRFNDSLFHQNFRHGEIYNMGYPGIYCFPLADKRNPNRPFSPFEHGKTILRELHTLRLTETEGALTGNIEFDRFGKRKNFLVTVIDLVSDSSSSFNKKEVFAWKQSFGFLNNRTVAQHTRKSQETERKKVVRVVTALVEPFVMIKRDCENSNATECQGKNRFEGYCIDLLKLLNDRNNKFVYEIFLSRDNKYGVKQVDGSWDGLVGYLLRGEADVAVASLTINQDRERVVDFSKPYMTTGISIMIKKPDKQEFSVFSFMQPLSTEIWMYIIFAYVGVSVVIFLVSRFSPYEWRIEEMPNGSGFTISNDFSVYNCLWFTLAAFMQQGTDILPRSISGRIASSAWWFFTMIIVSSYTANLAAFLTLEKMQAPIESVEDLAKQTKIKYGIQQGGSTAQFFKESQIPSVFTNNYAEGIERVRSHKGRYAFLLEATANEYANTRKPCDTMKVGANLNSVGYGVATPFGSEWKDDINLAILALQEKGELKKLENKWWYDRGQCDQGISDGSSASLNLSKVAGIFYILMSGMIISMFAAVGEFLYRSRIEARKGHMSSIKNLRASFYGQLKLSMQGGAVVHEGSSAHEALTKHKASSLLPANYNDQAGQIPGAGVSPFKRHSTNFNDNNVVNPQKKRNGGGQSKNSNKAKPPIPQIQQPMKTYNTAV